MFRNKKICLFLLGILIISVCAFEAFADSEHIDMDKITEESVNYRTVTAEKGNITKSLKVPGYLVNPLQREALYEGPDAYYVETIVTYGDKISAGEPLLKIRPVYDRVKAEELRLKLVRAKEDYDETLYEMQNALAIAETERAGLSDVYDIRFKDIEIAEAALSIERYIYETERNIAALEEALEAFTLEQSAEYVYAPYDGYVTDLHIFHESDILSSGDYICTLVDRDISFIQVDTPEYRYGEKVEIMTRFANGSTTYDGEVIITTAALPNSGFVGGMVKLFDEPEEGDRFNNVSVIGTTVDIRDVLLIPTDAAVLENGKYVVTLLGNDNAEHKRIINMGLNTREEMWVVNGLNDGDRLVIGN